MSTKPEFNIFQRFEQCIRELTPTSAIDVGNLISGEICEYYLSKFVGENSEERKLNGVFYSCMQHAITLLCCCLLNSKILTTSQSDLPLSVKKSVIDFLQSCCHKVVIPLRQCMAETTRKDYEFISYVQFSALLMSYTLLEVFTAFQCNGKEIPTDMYNAIISLQWKDKRIQVVNWSQRQCDLALENFKIRYLLTIYAVQRSVYSLLMPQNEEQSFVFEDYLYFINELPFNKNDLLINDVNSEDNANLDSSPVALMLVINEKTFPLYSWKLLLDKLPFYIAYLNNSQILDICRSLIKTMYSCPNSCTTKRNSSYYSISCGAIMQATLIDLQPFQSCLMSCILDEMKQLFNPIRNSLNLQSVVFEALGNLARPSFEWQSALHYPSSDDKASKSVNSEAWDIIEHAQRLIGASEMRWCIVHKPLHSEELSSLNDMHRLIKIFYMLPLDCLLPVNYTRCFLSLICWDWIISGALETEIDWRYRLQLELRQIMWLLLNPRVTLINTCHRFLKRLNPLTVLDNHLLTDLSSLNSKNASADRRVSSKETKELHKITTDIVSSAFRNWLGGKTLLKFASNLIKQLRPRIDDFVQEIMQVSSTSEIEQVILEHSLLLKFIFSVLEQIALSQEAVAIFNQERDNFIILFKICGHILYQSDEVPKTKRLKLSKASKIKSKDGRIVEAKGDVVNIFKSCRILIDIFRLLLQLVEPNVEFSFNQEIHDLYKIAFQELSNFASDLVPLLEDTVLINDSALCTSYVMYTSTFLEYHHYETNDEETSNTVNNFITLLLKLLTQSNGLRNSSSTKIDNHQINEVAEFRNCLQQAIVKLVVKSFSRENTSTFDNLLCETKTVSDNLILDLSNLKVRLYVWTELIAKLTIERKKAEYKDAFSTLLLTLVRMSYNLEGMSNKLLDSETCLLILKLIKQLLTQGKNSLTRDAVRSAFQICSTWPYEKNCISSKLYGDISKQKELAGKQLLHEGIFQIIEFCHDSDFTYLNSCVKETMKDSLKALHADYLKFYKFTGKI
ncbi:uncharacterized protein TRIADDRAFT_56079 [Trichoplax adhaerens]|uniref:Nucleolar 27S pre-rRNA processing Urb2/Npa2 C-terminal domain-containing protein n=1 Tax=Trichoplax adhaerens TaxID=10228 RepID=B3RTX5_TRIAD|nr:hypothetical protein TRIADDRAFT_56079 [Trichoplax adhaerens]EDV26211.1 hypothetical protein TRIADDRAFT_56079 [Trichoplax adhaerens]|eukprot:XP_002112244.1 hypothetical protein TRIADDRAFT_56079 [Trichoplax adhaerens]